MPMVAHGALAVIALEAQLLPTPWGVHARAERRFVSQPILTLGPPYRAGGTAKRPLEADRRRGPGDEDDG